MECSDDEGEEHEGEVEPEGNEEMKRLREINANDTDSDNESEQSVEEFFITAPAQAFRENFQSPHTWSWAMSPSERLLNSFTSCLMQWSCSDKPLMSTLYRQG